MRHAHAHAQRGSPVVAAEERPARAGDHFAQNDRSGDGDDWPPMGHQHSRIDQQTNRGEEHRAEHVAHRLNQGFDPMNLPRLGNDRPDDKRAERNAVTELGRQQRNAKAKTQHGNQEHFIALEFAHITDQTRHRDQTDHQHHDQENTQLVSPGS